MPTLYRRIERFLIDRRLNASGQITVRLGRQIHKTFVDTLPIDMRAAAMLGSKGFSHDGIFYIFDDDADHSQAVVAALDQELARIDPPSDAQDAGPYR